MYVVFLAGGIASGKSTVARELARLGARLIDLDALSREVLAPGTATTHAVASAFGADLVDPTTGVLNRRLLAERAFATSAATARLEAIELPAINGLLAARLAAERARNPEGLCVVEVPLLDRIARPHDLANEVVAVCSPAPDRLRRAVERGMDPADARARMAAQPTDEWLRAHADTLIDNVGTMDSLRDRVRAWWNGHASNGWG